MRGVLHRVNDLLNTLRFNPAYAGSISCLIRFSEMPQVQPRVCGEYMIKWLFIIGFIGSTPRMRGVLNHSIIVFCSGRFNPAYAGSMEYLLMATCLKQVQPRVCGEYVNRTTRNIGKLGSTPRMRGVYMQSESTINPNRFNPAYAGSILKKS